MNNNALLNTEKIYDLNNWHEKNILKAQIYSTEIDEFKRYLNNYISINTKFKSAEDLLKSSVSQKYIWICLCIPCTFIFIIAAINNTLTNINPILVFLISIFFGYPFALFIDFIKSFKIHTEEKFDNIEINPEDLINFLNEHLRHLSPYFYEWGYFRYEGLGVKEILKDSLYNVLDYSLIKVCTEFGIKKRCFVLINVDKSLYDPNKKVYWIDTKMRSIIPSKYICKVKTTPILKATMKYYLEKYRNG
ncbi:MAG: hypothetical protein ACTTKD_05265 [Peptoanaerobacter stomatis]|uniref:hypothetical protein n=1 Tax=Peptoanaerobacter stomatis TaxID=796937 RepID=UPI003FA0B062